MRVAYFVSRFPHPYQTFIERELRGVVKAGVEAMVYPLVRPWEGVDTAVESWRRLSVDVVYTAALSPRSVWSVLRRILRQPGACADLARMLIRDTWHRPLVLAKSLAALWKGIALADAVQKAGCTHVHAHWSSYAGTAALAVWRLTGIPFSLGFHAYDIFTTRILLREKIAESAFAVVNCAYSIGYLRALYPDLDQDKLKLVYNSIEADRFGGERRQPADGEPRILAVGRLIPTKGFDWYIMALQMLAQEGRRFRAMLIGSGPEHGRLKRLAVKAGLGEILQFEGRLDQAAVADRLREASVLVMPCVSGKMHDALPNVIMEAQTAGVPVVASNIFGIPETVVDGVTGLLVPPRDACAIKDAVARLLDDADLARELSANGRGRVAELFDPERNCARLVALFLGSCGKADRN
jgi:colanic acid/amylovoran biosynthesis glycosyltransferase